MDIWLDTVDCGIIEEAKRCGLLFGVTTNPRILAEIKRVPEQLEKILHIQDGPLAIQVTGNTAEKMIEEGLGIFSFSPRCIVKVPTLKEGLVAMKALREAGVPVMATAVITLQQAVFALQCGAEYIAPYLSHIEHGFSVIREMQTILRGSKTKLLLASLKEVDEITTAAIDGVDAVTLPPALYKMITADLSKVELFIERFHFAWQTMHGEQSIADVLAAVHNV